MIEHLYHDSGFLDMGAVLAAPYPFIVVIGARGVGKTYGALKDVAIDHPRTFIYFRRTRAIIELLMEPELQPFKRINSDFGDVIRPKYKKGIGRFMRGAQLLGYAAALSTFANVRGFDGSDIDVMIYDEFIPEPGEIVRYNSYTALLNAYETINRNRELDGQDPLKLILLSNSDNIYNDIVAGLGIADDLYYMQQTGTAQREKDTSLLLIRPAAKIFREKKAGTALYQSAGEDFKDVALDNRFTLDRPQNIKKRPAKEYIPIAAIAGVCFYKHKSEFKYYASDKLSGSPRTYGPGEAEQKRFFRENPAIWRAYMKSRIDYENIAVQTAAKKLFD